MALGSWKPSEFTWKNEKSPPSPLNYRRDTCSWCWLRGRGVGCAICLGASKGTSRRWGRPAAFRGLSHAEPIRRHLAGPEAVQTSPAKLLLEEKARDRTRTSNKSSACRVYKARAQPSQGEALARPVTERRARPINTTFLF